MIIYKILFFLFSKIKKVFYIVWYSRELQVDKKVNIDYNTTLIIKGKGKVLLESNVHLRSKKYGYHAGMPFNCTIFCEGDLASITIGENSRLNGCYVHSLKQITIGKNCVIASGVNILDANGHKTISQNRTIERDNPEEISIHDNVWIGLNAIVLKGTVIGKNSIVAANSVVKGHFPPNSLIVGNPGAVVKTLNI